MLVVTIKTVPDSLDMMDVPPDLKRGLDQASEILRTDFKGLAKKFDLSVEWNLVKRAESVYEVYLNLAAEDRVNLDPIPIPIESLQNTETIRRVLSTPKMNLVDSLSDLVGEDLEILGRRIKDDLASFATVSGE